MEFYVLLMGVLSFGQIITGLRVIRSRRFSVKHREGIPLFETIVTNQLDGYAAIFYGRCLLLSGMTIFLLWMLNTVAKIISLGLMFFVAVLIAVLIGYSLNREPQQFKGLKTNTQRLMTSESKSAGRTRAFLFPRL